MKQSNSKLEPSRLSHRGTTDRETILAILNEGIVAHISYAVDGEVYTLPVGYGYDSTGLYIHGSSQSRFFQSLAASSSKCCLSVALLDGLVLAKSAFHHSFNYRSAVIYAVPEKVTDTDEKNEALRLFTEKYLPGRWDDCRRPNEGELKATMVLKFSLSEASAKIRTGPPSDSKADELLPHWSGVVPLEQVYGQPIPVESSESQEIPNYLAKIRGYS
jgi:nitroimidazol reductase NimA-like FMN-containing flavoprotein (pyridoxamine 5'-phosphate oxidase superfamily)